MNGRLDVWFATDISGGLSGLVVLTKLLKAVIWNSWNRKAILERQDVTVESV